MISCIIAVSPDGSIQIDPTTINGNDSGNVTFNCMALGGPGNMFSWIKVRNSAVVVSDSELMLVDIMASDGGVYQCSVENQAGSDNATVTLNGNLHVVCTAGIVTILAVSSLCSFSSSDRTS